MTISRTRLRPRPWWLAPLAGAVAIAGIQLTSSQRAPAAGAPPVGVICTTSTSPHASFTLTARTGHILNPDGNSIFTWSYANGNGAFQYPGPVLCVNEGDDVTITLKNKLPEPTSIVFPGQEDVTANGGTAGPQFSGGKLVSLIQTAAANSGSVTYRFVASRAGTYLYESGTDQDKQLDMGLVGALVVRPAGHPSMAYDPVAGHPADDSTFNPNAEFVLLLSQMDPALHAAVEANQPFDMTQYHPRYFMINGRSFPDTIAPNNASWLPSQPYGSLVEFQAIDPTQGNDPGQALVRYVNTGPVAYPFHPHGNHGRVIARDGRLLVGPNGEDLSFEKFTINVGAGQTVDATYNFTRVYDPNVNPVPVAIPPLQNLLFKDNQTYYSGSVYLGSKGALPVGTTQFNQCGEYYHFMHSHALFQVSNFGAAGGGMLTLMRVDPAGGCP
jgi:FtsP/CotA-like multicopper oxidase with cupredoxin domain